MYARKNGLVNALVSDGESERAIGRGANGQNNESSTGQDRTGPGNDGVLIAEGVRQATNPDGVFEASERWGVYPHPPCGGRDDGPVVGS